MKLNIRQDLYKYNNNKLKNNKKIKNNIENHYEDTIKAIISIEKNVNNGDMLDYLYDMYMNSSSMLLNLINKTNDKMTERL